MASMKEMRTAHAQFKAGCGTSHGMDVQYNPSKAHPGFKAVQSGIAKRMGVSKDRAGAILASATRNASAAAKKKNPRLKRVKG